MPWNKKEDVLKYNKKLKDYPDLIKVWKKIANKKLKDDKNEYNGKLNKEKLKSIEVNAIKLANGIIKNIIKKRKKNENIESNFKTIIKETKMAKKKKCNKKKKKGPNEIIV